MNRLRLAVLAAFAALVFASVIIIAQNRTHAQGGALDDAPPLLERPATSPTPERPAAPVRAKAVGGTVLLEDTFADEASNAAWTAVDLVKLPAGAAPARWGVREGVMSQLWTGEHFTIRPDQTIAVTGSPDWTDYVFHASAYAEFNSEIGLVFRRQGNSFYRVRMLPDVLEAAPKVLLEKVVDGRPTVLASLDQPGYEPYRWYDITVTVQGSQITAQIGDLPPLTAEDTTLANGEIGLYSLALGHVHFDNVLVVAK